MFKYTISKYTKYLYEFIKLLWYDFKFCKTWKDWRLYIYKYKEKFVILQVIRIKSKETRVVAYTCRYSSGQLISLIQPLLQTEI